ncbi:MAG: HAD family hydrolase [Spirochaetia bacterium]
MNGPRAIIFDLDGTLADTLADLTDVTNAVLADNGFPGHAEEAYRDMVGWGLTNLIVRALPEDRRRDETVNALAAELLRRYTREPVIKTRPYPGILSMLEELEERGIPMSVLSNKADPVARRVVERILPGKRFTAVRGAVDGVPKKPDPRSALEIGESMGFPPEKVLFIGDSTVDMHTARAAGMIPAGVSWGFRPPEELLREGAEFIFEKPREIPARMIQK